MKGLVSVIVPFYKSEKTLEKCVKSITNQTYNEIEILLINDRGNDNSFQIAKRLEKEDKRIKVFDKKHMGVSGTRNYGLKRASGDYIEFVDSDDTLEPTIIEKMVNLLIDNNAELAICNYDHPVFKNYLGNCVLDISKREDMLKYVQNSFAVIVPWNKLWKRSSITKFFDETIMLAEDDYFNLVNLQNVKHIASTNEVLYHYYLPPAKEETQSTIASMSRTNFWEDKSSFWYLRNSFVTASYKDIREFLNKKQSKDVAYSRLFDFMIWEFLIFKAQNASLYGITKEMKNVFSEKSFRKCLKIRKKYGVKYKYKTKKDDGDKVIQFANRCFKIIDDPKTSNLKHFYVMLALFVKMFVSQKGKIDRTDIIANALADLNNNESEESKYINDNF